MDRRRFLQLAAAGMITKFGIDDAMRRAEAGPANFASMLAMAKVNPIETEYIPGPSCCLVCPKIVVHHYLPVAFVELIKSPTDSFFFPEDVMTGFYTSVGGGLSSDSIMDDGTTQTFGVRIWDIPDYIIDELMSPGACRYCDKSYAIALPDQDLAGLIGVDVNPACVGPGVIGKAVAKMTDMLSAQTPLSCFPRIYYDSALDPNWRTACQDMSLTQAVIAAANVSTGGMAESLCSMTGGALSEAVAKLGVSVVDATNPCIGGWGPLFPRGMSVVEANTVVAASMTAYRALHLAGFYYSLFPYKVGLGGKMKMVYPPSPTEILAGHPGGALESLTDRLVPQSIDHRYGFLWYAPVMCCKLPFSMIGACLPSIPCLGASGDSMT